jgi:hypothetical protein
MDEDECVHGMNPDWCAPCLGQVDPKEEERQDDAKFLANLFGIRK